VLVLAALGLNPLFWLVVVLYVVGTWLGPDIVDGMHDGRQKGPSDAEGTGEGGDWTGFSGYGDWGESDSDGSDSDGSD
jgi:hypothetical protein